MAKFEQYVDAFLIFEEVLEFYNVLVVHAPVNFNLTHKLLLCSAFLERTLQNHFARRENASLLVHHLVAFGEATFAQELPASVPPDVHIPIVFHNFLLY